MTDTSKSDSHSQESQPKRPSEIQSPEKNNLLATSFSSLITEDLSDEIPTTKSDWFLLSEEEQSNCSPADNNNVAKQTNKHRDYLSKLFPITCAVPDLSTITEISRETDETSNARPENKF